MNANEIRVVSVNSDGMVEIGYGKGSDRSLVILAQLFPSVGDAGTTAGRFFAAPIFSEEHRVAQIAKARELESGIAR